MKKVRFFYIYIYIVPALLSLSLIISGNTLLGDFRSYSYEMDIFDFIATLIQFLLPLAIIYLLMSGANKLIIFKSKDNVFECFVLMLFVYIFLVTFFIGAVKIGASNVGGAAGLLMSLVVKLNPYLLLGILAFSNVKARTFTFCLLVCVLYCFKQVSLQGYLVSLFSLITFLLVRKKVSNKLFFTLLIAPFFAYGIIFEALTYVYSIRNEMRGVEFEASQIMALALGRISSLSSYIYIRESLYDFTAVSDFFSLGIFSERLFGFSAVDTVSPTFVFNNAELGEADYSIFLGLNGFLLSMYESSILIFIFNVIIILLALLIIFQMLPFFNKDNRVLMFFLIMYMPILSFDIWEISIVFQSLILINVLFFLYRLVGYCFLYRLKLNHKGS